MKKYSVLLLLLLATVNEAQTAEEYHKAGVLRNLVRRRDLGDGNKRQKKKPKEDAEAIEVVAEEMEVHTVDVGNLLDAGIEKKGGRGGDNRWQTQELQTRERDGVRTRNGNGRDKAGGGDQGGMKENKRRGGNKKKTGPKKMDKNKVKGTKPQKNTRNNGKKAARNNGKAKGPKPRNDTRKNGTANKPDNKGRRGPVLNKTAEKQKRDPLHETEKMRAKMNAGKRNSKGRKLEDASTVLP